MFATITFWLFIGITVLFGLLANEKDRGGSTSKYCKFLYACSVASMLVVLLIAHFWMGTPAAG